MTPPNSTRAALTGVLVALLLSAVLGVVGAAPALACGGSTYSYGAKKNANLGKPPFIIGDSTMVFAAPKLARRGFISNARECRQWSEGLSLLDKYSRKNRYGKVGVMALGSNAPLSKGEIHKALKIVGKKRILGLVTPYEAGGRTANAKLMRKEAHRHKRILLIDWVHHSRGHSEWFAGDGIHVTYEGAAEQARYYAHRVFKRLEPPHGKRR